MDRLGRAHRHAARAEYVRDRLGFGGVASERRRAVRVEVADRRGVEAGVGERRTHRPCLARSVGVGDVDAVAVGRVANEAEPSRRAARACVLDRLEDERASAFTEGEAGAVGGERPARAPCRAGGVGAAADRRQHPHRLPAGEHARRQQRLAAAGDGDVDPAGADRPHRFADRHRRRSAGAGVGEGGAACAEAQRELGDGRVRHRRDDARRPHAAPVGIDAAARHLEGRRAGHAAAPEDAEALGIEAADGQARVARRVFGGGERHRRAAVERHARRRDHARGIEGCGGDRHRRQLDAGQIENVGADRRAAGEERLVEGAQVVADRTDDAAAADGDRRAGRRSSR